MPQDPTPVAPGHHDARPGEPRRVGTPVIALLVAGTLLVGVGLGYSLALSQTREAAAEAAVAREDLERLARAHAVLQERNWMLYLQVEEAGTAEPGGQRPVPSGAFTDGTYRVGADIEPGTYLGEVDGDFGYWARLRNTTGIVSGIIANDIVRGPFVLTIVPSDTAVELRGVILTAED